MHTRLWTAASTTAICALLVALPALASDQSREIAKEQLARHDITVKNFDALSDTEISQINLILDTSAPKSDAAGMVKTVLAKDSGCVEGDQLRQNVKSELLRHKIDVKNFESMSDSELILVDAVLQSGEPGSAKRIQIERIFTAITPDVANNYLRADTAGCVKELKADVNLDKLTSDQMLRIQTVAAGPGDMMSKRSMIEKIAVQS